MAITSNCAEIIITNPQGSISFNKLITTTELSPAKTIYSEDRVYLIQNSENVPQTFWWNLEKAIADGYADLEELYDYFVAEIANQCGGGGGGSPAGSDNQIQINQSGSFFADSSFQKSDTGFNVGLDHTAQSAVSFTGSGLDDLTIGTSGDGYTTFNGTPPTTYTVTVDGVNVDIISIESSTISGGTFAVGNTITNGLGGTATVNSVVESQQFGDVLKTNLGVTITAGTFGTGGDTIDNGLGVTGIGYYSIGDTFEFTDGTTTLSNIPINSGAILTNDVVILFNTSTGHTLSDSWTWTYTSANQNVLDFSNNDYKFQSVFGTDTFGYQISDNLLGFGLKGSANTYTNVAGDMGVSGIFSGSQPQILDQIGFADRSVTAQRLIKNQYDVQVSNGTVASFIGMTATTFGIRSDLSSGEHGISQSAGVVSVGNLIGGNNTKITIDDVNEHITISNLPAFDDDAAAGTGGLTAGMVYMTTGSGSAPLNTAGILMIKQ